MADYQRIIRQQAIREAEGYLDLAMGFAEPVADRSATADAVGTTGAGCVGTTGQDRQDDELTCSYLTGQAYRVMHRYRRSGSSAGRGSQTRPREHLHLAGTGLVPQTHRADLDLAIESLENALAVETREAILHYNLACYWSLAGNSKIALRYLAQSFDIDPTYREMVADETDFDPIRDLPDFQSSSERSSDEACLIMSCSESMLLETCCSTSRCLGQCLICGALRFGGVEFGVFEHPEIDQSR